MNRIAWKKVLIAGLAGYACGKLPRWYRNHTHSAQVVLVASAAAGVTGASVGWGSAVYRNMPSASRILALSLGANCAIAAGFFVGLRTAALHALPEQKQWLAADWGRGRVNEIVSGVGSGAVMGAVAAVVSWRGVTSLLLSSGVGAGLGMGVELGIWQFERWRRRKSIKLHFPELVDKSGMDWSRASVEHRFMSFWHRHSRSAQLDTEIALLVEDIVTEREREGEVDQKLAGRGGATGLNADDSSPSGVRRQGASLATE